jgi:uncharacterized protein YdaU (DUF1376 family)
MKPLPYARIYVSDLMSECLARGLGQRERGVLFSLLWLQHVEEGSIPASLRELRRRIGDDAKDAELATVIKHFFPITGDGRRANHQHADAYKAATKAYIAAKNRGDTTAATRWSSDSQTTSQTGSQTDRQTTRRRSQTTSQTDSNQNQSQYLERELPEHPEEEEEGDALEPAAADASTGQRSVDDDGDDDHLPF